MTKRQSLWSLISFSRHPHQWNLQMKKEYYVYRSLKCRVSPEKMKITKAHEESERTQRVSLCQCILLCCCLLLSIPSQFLRLKQIHDLMNIPLSSWKVIIPCFVRPFRLWSWCFHDPIIHFHSYVLLTRFDVWFVLRMQSCCRELLCDNSFRPHS